MNVSKKIQKLCCIVAGLFCISGCQTPFLGSGTTLVEHDALYRSTVELVKTSHKKKIHKKEKIFGPLAQTAFAESSLPLEQQITQCEAQLIDIPIPIMVTPLGLSYGTAGGVLLNYTSSVSAAVLRDFYKEEMERFGWEQVASFEAQEILLHYKKQGRFCNVSIRFTGPVQKSKKVELFLFVSD